MNPLTGPVLVTHPGLQHAHQLALALHEAGLLGALWSGVPVTEDGSDIPFWLPRYFRQRVKQVPIPRELRHHPLAFQAAFHAGRLLRPGSRSDYAHRVFHAYDWWVSRQIERVRPRAVVAYENAAFHTFRAARAVGARCILDAPALHHAAMAALAQPPHTPYTDEINRRKDAEVAQADLVLTCSPLAARSYTAHEVPADKVHALLLGAELPRGRAPARFEPGPRPRFVFAGVASRHKAVDVILETFAQLHRENVDCELLMVGGIADPAYLRAIEALPNARHQPSVPQSQLFDILAQADCLLLPSRFDSFGMVVAEAMACGTPAIVSTQAGAQAIVQRHPGSGWVVEPTVESLLAQVRHLARARAELRDARAHALAAAADFTWQRYRRDASALIAGQIAGSATARVAP